MFDVTYARSGGTSRSNWDSHAEKANRIGEKWWFSEVRIPLTSVGVDHIELGSSWGIQVTRDWKQPSTYSAWTSSGNFSDPATMGNVTFSRQCPVVKLKRIGDVFRGELAVQLDVYNPFDEPRRVSATIDISSTGAPIQASKVLTIPAGQTKTLRLARDIPKDLRYRADIQVASADGETTYFTRQLKWKPHDGPRWETVGSRKKDIVLDMAYYPYKNKIRARVDLSTYEAGDDITGAR